MIMYEEALIFKALIVALHVILFISVSAVFFVTNTHSVLPSNVCASLTLTDAVTCLLYIEPK